MAPPSISRRKVMPSPLPQKPTESFLNRDVTCKSPFFGPQCKRFLKVGNLSIWMLTPTATTTMTNCIGITNCVGKRRSSKKTVEKPIVNHKTVRAVIFVFIGSPLPSL